MSMKKANSMKNLRSYQCRSIGFSLTQVRINRERERKKKKKRVKQIQRRFLSKQLFGPRRLRQLSVEWGLHSHGSLVAKLGKESELKPHCHRNTNFCVFLFLIKPYMRTANKFHVSWLYRRKNLNVCVTWQYPSSLEAGWSFQSIPTGCVLFIRGFFFVFCFF